MSASADPPTTVADRAFEMLRQNPPVSPDVFDFAVVADTRSLKVDQQSETFKQLIHDFNVLKPAFVVDVGDIILGGSADLVPAQWDEFDRVTADLHVPLFPAVGNHDVFDEATADAGSRLLARVVAANIELAPRERLLLQLCFRDGVAVTEAGRMLGWNRFQVHGRLRRLLERLRRELARVGLEEELRLLL